MATVYLKTGWTKHSSQGLFTAKGVTARDVLREKGTPAAEVGLLDLAVISSAMVVHPILVNRQSSPRRRAFGSVVFRKRSWSC